MSPMEQGMNRIAELYGQVELTPSRPVVAGATGTWVLTYTTGQYGFDDGGTIKVLWRFVSDWGAPQTENPAAPNYLTATTNGQARLRLHFDPKAYVRPWQKGLVISIFDAPLEPGETVTITYGDTSGGSPGTRAQTFWEESFEFKVAVDPFGTGIFTELPSSPAIPIINGPPLQLVVVAPSEIRLDQEFTVKVRAEDMWGNPCRNYIGALAATIGQSQTTYQGARRENGVYHISGLRCSAAGTCIVSVKDEQGLQAESNPIICQNPTASLPVGERRHPFWGDLHGQSEETVGTNSVEDYFRFARDFAMLDFTGHQGNDFQITQDFWERLKQTVRAFHQPHHFIPFLGYEWSATTPAGGDRNVHLIEDDAPLHRTSHQQVADRSDESADRYPITALYQTLRQETGNLDPAQRKALLVPHIGGRPCNLRWHDPELEPVIEIISAWGEFEWLLREALERGYVIGFSGGSDDHKGRPGASHPGAGAFGVYGGLTCVYARELTRAAIWEALWQRRCYATTGQRLLLRFATGSHMMGEIIEVAAPPLFQVEVIGTAEIERVDFFRGTELVYTFPAAMPRAHDTVRIAWSGARIKGRARNTNWDGTLQIRDGAIRTVQGYAFDTPAEGIRSQSLDSVTWQSVTTGDTDGIIVQLDGTDSTQLEFHTNLLQQTLTLGEIRAQGGGITTHLGGVDLQVVFELMPLGTGRRHLQLTYTDDRLPAAITPYWVRVTQVDGAKAWASPIYVKPGSGRNG
ncbi:MAG: DUF3604 domain-containing protein [Chloroflexi bacterium]|nr:DUF3604 domain-containing protein [Chloroflexota bacterium]